MFGSCYRYNVKPTNGADMWPETGLQSILPPRRRRMPERLKVNRNKCLIEKEGKHTVSKKGAFQNVVIVIKKVTTGDYVHC